MLKNDLARKLPPLPIDDCLEELLIKLDRDKIAVLVAPPGAGKTSRVPLALIDQTWVKDRKILVLEPRRLAAKSASAHMANLLGEPVGKTVGYRVRMDTKVSNETRIEFITDGVFTRMVLADPELTGVAAVVFDEVHERSLNLDLGLALTLDSAEALRPDLRILPMSATLNGSRVAKLLKKGDGEDVGIVLSEGRAYPIEYRYVSKPPNERVEDAMAKAIKTTLENEDGSLLCFLPGQAEIHRVMDRVKDLPSNIEICPLYGALDQSAQTRAVQPIETGRRKIVLATSIAETSITIQGIRIVIDSGLARVPRYEVGTGLTRLVTVKAAKSSIDQRAGRAGRTEPGIAIRLWHEGQTGSLPEFEKPEILEADLSNLVLDLANWGVKEPAMLKFLDQPPTAGWSQAVEMLTMISALDENGNITAVGKHLAELPLPPRLGYMLLRAAELGAADSAALLSILIEERGLGGKDIDLAHRMKNFENARDERSRKAKAAAKRLVSNIVKSSNSNLPERDHISIGSLLSFAWPDRIAKKTADGPDGSAQFQMINARRVRLDSGTLLAKEKFVVVAELQGSAASARIVSAAAISQEEITSLHLDRIFNERIVEFDSGSKRVVVRDLTRLGAIELARSNGKLNQEDMAPQKLIEQLQLKGLEGLDFGFAETFRKRAHFLHTIDPQKWRSFELEDLEIDLVEWLLPMIPDAVGYSDITPHKILDGLNMRFGLGDSRGINRLLPKSFTAPSGIEHPLDYQPEKVILRAKVQEFFGMNQHPTILDGQMPITLELLSPAMRPIQTTQDIANFWSGSWKDVRADLRGRYPKHFWPENPANSLPTHKAKPRG